MEPILQPLLNGWRAGLTAKADAPAYRVLCRLIRADVLAGKLQPGAKLPASRVMAKELSISRNTVLGAYELLTAEGVIEGKVGHGTRIAAKLPDDTAFHVTPALDTKADTGPADPAALDLFSPGIPDLTLFPFNVWGRISGRVWRKQGARLAATQDARGFAPLRRAIADHIGPARGVAVSTDAVMVVSGAQQALDLVARSLLAPGDIVAVENPCYRGLVQALRYAGVRVVSVPTDEEGVVVSHLETLSPAPKLVVVTPSRVFPTGAGLSLTRRLALLAWADRQDSWVIEDDYDSDYRYDGPPLGALYDLDQARRVIYVGSFSRVLFPTIRLGFMVPPKDLLEPLIDIRRVADGFPAAAPQAVLAQFFEEGHYSSHVKRTRKAYALRRRALTEALSARLNGRARIIAGDGGLHLCLAFTRQLDDLALSARLRRDELGGEPLSNYFVGSETLTGLVLGFAAHPPDALAEGAEQLCKVIWP